MSVELQKLQAYAATEKVATSVEVEQDRQLREALCPLIQEYQAVKVDTPALIDEVWYTIWRVIGDSIDYRYDVPSCDRSKKELAQLRKQERGVLLLPDAVYTPAGLARLGRIFPLMRSWTIAPSNVARIKHESAKGGCIDIEMNLDSPYRTTPSYNEDELQKRLSSENRFGQRLPTYFIGSQYSQWLTGHYFDENSWSRLPGSFFEGKVLCARFQPEGSVRVFSWFSGGRASFFGGRSEGGRV